MCVCVCVCPTANNMHVAGEGSTLPVCHCLSSVTRQMSSHCSYVFIVTHILVSFYVMFILFMHDKHTVRKIIESYLIVITRLHAGSFLSRLCWAVCVLADWCHVRQGGVLLMAFRPRGGTSVNVVFTKSDWTFLQWTFKCQRNHCFFFKVIEFRDTALQE